MQRYSECHGFSWCQFALRVLVPDRVTTCASLRDCWKSSGIGRNNAGGTLDGNARAAVLELPASEDEPKGIRRRPSLVVA